MTRRTKLGLSAFAFALNAIAASALLTPARAMSLQQCSTDQRAYAQGFSDATCASQGYSGSSVSSCNQANGSFTWNFACY